MENRVLAYFLMVAREESITKAAERLHITQPTLSRQMTNLEEEYGVKLLYWEGRRISLTPAGILLRKRAEDILYLVHQTEKELVSSGEDLEGTIYVAGGDLAATYDFVKLIKEFRERHPKVEFNYYSGVTTEIRERMDRGMTDIGILVDSYDFEKYEYLPIGKPMRNGIYMKADDPMAEKEYIRPEDLKGKTVILSTRKDLNSQFSSWAGEAIKSYDLGLSVSLPNNKTIMVDCGMGYSMSSEGVVPVLDESRICFRPFYPEMWIHTFLAWRRNQPFSPPAEAFISFLKENIKKD